MLTQKEQLEKATKAYIFELSNTRFSVYLLIDGELRVLWPSDSHNGKKSKELLPGQIYSVNQRYPAFHFHLTGCGYSKKQEIVDACFEINPKLRFFSLNGVSPSSV